MMDAALPTETVDPEMALGALKEALCDCRLCGLCDGRTQVVFGVGSARAELLFVGEGPGFHEDRQGEPFVGQAGKLLTTLLGQIGLTREEVYIANVVKCRPPENRDPTPAEIEACSPHLMQQIGIIRPRVICTLGRFATRLLTGTELSMTAVHGRAKPLELGGVETIVFPVFHPAAALYAPANRVVLEEDFAKLRRLLDRGRGALSGGGDETEPTTVHAQVDESVPDSAPALDSVPAAEVPAAIRAERRTPPTDREEQLPLW
jgi:uracil-DNA glycosylase